MAKYAAKKEKKNSQANMKVLLVVCCIIILGLVIAIACILAGQGGNEPPVDETQGTQSTQSTSKPERTPIKEMILHNVEEQGNSVVVVETSYGTVKYPFAFSDLIGIEPVNEEDRVAMAFFANINETPLDLFTIWFNSSEGIPLGTMKLEGMEEPVKVTAVIHEAYSGLDGGDLNSFYAAQETFNDVVTSLSENEGFTPAG